MSTPNHYEARSWPEAMDWALSLDQPESFFKPTSRPRINKQHQSWVVSWDER